MSLTAEETGSILPTAYEEGGEHMFGKRGCIGDGILAAHIIVSDEKTNRADSVICVLWPFKYKYCDFG